MYMWLYVKSIQCSGDSPYYCKLVPVYTAAQCVQQGFIEEFMLGGGGGGERGGVRSTAVLGGCGGMPPPPGTF